MNEDKTGVIYDVEQRSNYISRKAPKIRGAGYRGERLEQIIASNIDNLIIVCSTKNPDFNNRTLDRFIVLGESSGVVSIIILNKMDLINPSEFNHWINLYTNIGYKVIKTSIIDKTGIKEFKSVLIGNKNLISGPSGAGKSSLLNSAFPGLNLKTKKISRFTEKGVHTTVTSNMIPINENTYVIDTPGLREVDPYGIKKEDLGFYFREFKRFMYDCRFNTCTHLHEPDCAVINAVRQGKISPERYNSYLRLLETIEEDIHFN